MHDTVSVYEKYVNQCLRIYIYVAHTAFCVFIQYGSELCNNQVKVVWAFSYTETGSFHGPETCMYERFRGSK